MTPNLKHSYTGIILAGGHGTRLRPLTHVVGKPLLPVGDKPMIAHGIDLLKNAGITNIAVVINSRDAAAYLRYLGDGSEFGVSISYAYHPEESWGMPYAIKQAKQIANPDDRIVVVAPDVLIENGIVEAVEQYDAQADGALIITAHMDDTAGYGLLETNEDRAVTTVMEKDKSRHEPGFIELGMVCFPYSHFELLEKLYPAESELPAQSMYKAFLEAGTLTHGPVEGFWTDAGGNFDLYHEVNERFRGR